MTMETREENRRHPDGPDTFDDRFGLRLRQVARGFGLATIAVGALVLVGWELNLPLLKSGLPGAITMKANTAVGLMLLACGMLSLVPEAPRTTAVRAGRIAVALAALIGVATLAEYLLGRNLGLDELLFRDPDGGGRFPPGRLAPITAVNFVVLTIAIFGSRKWPRFSQALALVSLVVATQAVVGYLVGTTYAFGSAYYTQIAVHTALLFVLLSVGLLCTRPREGFMLILTAQTAGGELARGLIGWTLVIPPLLTWVQLEGQRLGLYDADFGVLLRLMGNILFFAALVFRTAQRLHEADLSRRAAEQELARSAGRLEQAVQARTQELELVNRELESFSYSVSHDLRAPLRAIDGFTRAVRDDKETVLSPKSAGYFNRVLAAADRMGHLIDDLLKLSRLTRQPIRVREIDVTALVRAVAEVLSIPVTVEEGLRARADEGLLRIALENLLGNAAKFTSRTEKAVIEVFAPERGVLAVRDNGAGFDPAYASRLFVPFQRLHGPEFPGSGIGLATVQKVVQRHGGRVWAEGRPGAGATFFLTLPHG